MHFSRWHGLQERFVCRECRKKKPAHYFASETLCKKCAAKRRRKPWNPVERVGELQVTHLSLRRLRKQADRQVPRTFRDALAGPAMVACSALGWYGFLLLGMPDLVAGSFWLELLWMLFAGLAPMLVGVMLMGLLEAPRASEVAARVKALARERQAAMEEAERFYASPEWNALRDQIIDVQGRICRACRRKIRQDDDVTVDHIKPRSRFPQLALEPSNLQVLCRSCNSSKGDRDEMDARR